MESGSSIFDAKDTVKRYALEVGFDLVRVSSAQDFSEDRAAALERLGAGLMDGLPWYTEARVLRGTSPKELLPGARSIICLGLSYFLTRPPAGARPDRPAAATEAAAGRVARYARGRDYHKPMKKRMRAYVDGLRARLDTQFAARWYVDDGPMLDRAAARRAGLGWTGKNTNILTPSHGSWVFLGQVITDLKMEADPPLMKTCGGCTGCIDACPTGAIVAPYVVDNTRCISYLTIENRGPIPTELRPLMRDWVFGCDICQDVCPVNRKALPSRSTLWQRGRLPSGLAREEGDGGDFPEPGLESLDLVGLLEMSEEEFQRRFRGTPVLRAKRGGLQRNACVALGNRRDPATVPSLRRALLDGDSLVRRHAAWALGQTGTGQARRALEQAGAAETDPEVVQEIVTALRMPRGAVAAE